MIISEATDHVIVEARFAGGPIIVERNDRSGLSIVELELPGATVWLLPGEARALADALLRNVGG